MKFKDERGFTLIEVIVVAGIIAILAGILVPLIFKELDESRIARASADVRSIYTAMMIFKKDTAQWPVMDSTCNLNTTLLRSDGNLPTNIAAMGYDSSVTTWYYNHLSTDPISGINGCYSNWKGAYIATVTADPWNNSYITNADAFSILNREVWIISAGPNGLMDTPAFNFIGGILVGDDIGLRVK